MLDHYGRLQIAVLAYFILALPVAIYICIRQGWGRHAGWLYLLSLTLVRIVGAILRIVSETHPSTGVIIAAAVFAAIGLIPLLLCFMGMVKRVNDGTRGRKMPPRAFQFIHLITIIGLALAIAGASMTGSDESASTMKTATTLRKASSILFLVSVIGNTLLMLTYATQMSFIHPGDRIIVMCALAAAPFLFVRIIYSILVSFENNKTFNILTPNIYVEAIMQSLMEFIVFALFALAGIVAPRIAKGEYTGGGRELGTRGDHLGKAERGERYVGGQPQYNGTTRGHRV
jgi:hypothetical protein